MAVLAFDDCQSLDVMGPLEVFVGAGYAAVVVSMSGEPVTSSSGVGIVPAMSLASARRRGIDTLVVAGGQGARAAARVPATVSAVRRAASGSRRVASVCTGAFVLAATGLLDGRRATTHFAYCAALARDFPQVNVDPEPIYVRDGKLWTSAGVTAGIDLALALVEEDYGAKVSLQIARQLVVFMRRAGGQSQFSPQLAAEAKEPGALRELQSFISEHPESALHVPELARRARMSVRNFSRVFRSRFGFPPAEYVERVRVELAKRVLETSEKDVESVARDAGFGTPEALRRAFARRVGLSPREYRARFGRP